MIKFHSFASFSPIFDEEIIEFMSTALKTVFKNTAAKLNLFFFRRTDGCHTNDTIILGDKKNILIVLILKMN